MRIFPAEKTSASSHKARPVLMIPLRRCGSHALRLRLNCNPQFYSPYPLHIVDFMPLVPSYGNLADDNAYFQLVVDVVGLQAASLVKWADVVFNPVDIFESIRNQPRSVHRIVWELLLRAGERQNASVVMDKSLDSVHYAAELMALFPRMLFLNVVRDPRAQVASMNKAIIHDFDTTLNANTWVNAHRIGRSLALRYPDRVLTIRYEDFLSDQEAVLKQVCKFFGIDFLPQMLDVSRSQEANQIAKLSALWESNCFAPIAANRDKFKQQLTMEEIRVIETLTQEFMQLYGYEPMTDAKAKVTEDILKESRERSDIRRTDAWHSLKENNHRDFILRRFRADYLDMVRNRLERNSVVSSKRMAETTGPV